MTKVLIVEDEPLVARMYQKSLSFSDIDSEVAIGGLEGLNKAKKILPDLILLDIMMPEPDGMEVLEKLKEDPDTKNIPVVILTNLSGKYDSELAKEKGAVDYWVKKDAEPKELGRKIEELLNSKKT
ncbi:MAG TPA: response regulator [Patescibacteria group bacterium]|nr:response regulator [Patescibacteria group bacterium]